MSNACLIPSQIRRTRTRLRTSSSTHLRDERVFPSTLVLSMEATFWKVRVEEYELAARAAMHGQSM